MNKRAQMGGGVVIGLVIGIAFLIISAIIAFTIVTNVSSIDDTLTTTSTPATITNESVTGLAEAGDSLAASTYGLNSLSCTAVAMVNSSDSSPILATGNYSLGTDCTLAGIAASPFLTYNVKITYYYTYSQSANTADKMISNFTSGVDNISGKIPTALLVGAIVLILGVLAVLVGVWQRMRMGGGSL